jgi:hypothetical protein
MPHATDAYPGIVELAFGFGNAGRGTDRVFIARPAVVATLLPNAGPIFCVPSSDSASQHFCAGRCNVDGFRFLLRP